MLHAWGLLQNEVQAVGFALALVGFIGAVEPRAIFMLLCLVGILVYLVDRFPRL